MPHADDGFHVEVGGEEDYHAVGCEFGEFCEEVSVVSDDGGFVADSEAGGDWDLVGSTGYYHG